MVVHQIDDSFGQHLAYCTHGHNRKSTLTFVVIAVGALVVASCGNPSGGRVQREDDIRVSYGVQYADHRPGEALITYIDGEGVSHVAEVVTPWTTSTFLADRDDVLRISASAQPRASAHLECTIYTDEGPQDRVQSQSSPTGECFVEWEPRSEFGQS